MTYTIKDHGVWRAYTPDPLPAWVEAAAHFGGVIGFLKRESDGMDWYAYNGNASTFATDSLLATTMVEPSTGREIVKAVLRDHTMQFPINQHLIEIFGVDPDVASPHDLFTEKVYDPTTQTFSDQVKPPKPVITAKADIWRRVTDEEAETIVSVLGQQTVRKQRMFNDAQYIDHADDLYAELAAGFTQAFGADRTAEILAPSY